MCLLDKYLYIYREFYILFLKFATQVFDGENVACAQMQKLDTMATSLRGRNITLDGLLNDYEWFTSWVVDGKFKIKPLSECVSTGVSIDCIGPVFKRVGLPLIPGRYTLDKPSHPRILVCDPDDGTHYYKHTGGDRAHWCMVVKEPSLTD